jgi:hypothetical protein
MWNWGFEAGGPLNSTRAGLLNHHTSKISPISFWSQIPLWVFKIRGFECGIGILKQGEPLNSTRARLLYHQISKISPISFWSKFLCRCLKFEGLKVELEFSSGGDPLLPPGRGC